jgi:anaerobic magnesium-protoporphyrin IX monomethyl ester cyclase
LKIFIGQIYFRILDPKEQNRSMPYPPLGPIILATKLKDEGFEVDFFDAMISSDPDEIFNKIQSSQPDLILLYDDEFNYLTKMSLLNMRENSFKILSFCKQRELPVLVYTSDAIDHPEVYLTSGADGVIFGEGEIVVDHFLTLNSNIIDIKSLKFEAVPGIAFLDNNGKLQKTEKLPLMKNLDELPLPDLKEFIDIDTYREIWYNNHGYFSLNISTSRGCTYGCNWCAKPLWGRTYNVLSPSRAIEMFTIIEQDMKADHIWITDDIFALKKGWLEEFAILYKEKNLKIPYKCLSRADLLLKDNTLELLAETNCEIIWIGAESGSQKILDAMEKGTKVEQILEATKKARELGINVAFFIQFGYLGENWEDIKLTRRLILDADPEDIGISVSYPLPGTKFYQMVQDHLQEKRNWTDSDDLDMLFHGTFQREFYKVLHRLVHNEYRFYKYFKKFNLIKTSYHGLNYLYYRTLIRGYKKSNSVNLPLVDQ